MSQQDDSQVDVFERPEQEWPLIDLATLSEVAEHDPTDPSAAAARSADPAMTKEQFEVSLKELVSEGRVAIQTQEAQLPISDGSSSSKRRPSQKLDSSRPLKQGFGNVSFVQRCDLR